MNLALPDSSPFLADPQRPRVRVCAGRGAYENTAAVLEDFDLAPARGTRVLVKPNVGRMARPGDAVTTHPDVVAAVVDAFLAAGADVAVGESPIVGVDVAAAFASGGITAVAAERGCRLIDMDRRAGIDVPVPGGAALDTLKVCADVADVDLVVSVPVMKMHMHTGVTLSVKNMKGCLWRRSKVRLHMLPPVAGYDEKPIDVAIADMSTVLRPQLAVIDGTWAMEGMGPSAGSPRPLDVAVAAADPFAADAVACRLMGVDPGAIAHLRLGAEQCGGVIAIGRMAVGPGGWEDAAADLARPPADISVEFDGVTVHDRQSCSACQSTLMLFLKRYGARIFDYFPPDTAFHIAIGKGHDDLPAGTFCVGNCTGAHRETGTFIPGCPPVASQILRALTGRDEIDTADGAPRDEDG